MMEEKTENMQTNTKYQCRTCENKDCEYYDIRENMSAGQDRQTGWRASPAVITFAVGCLSHSALAEKDAEIVRLKYQITDYHEAIEVLRESKDKEITHLKDEIEKRNVIIRDHCAEISKLKKSYEDGYKEYEKVERENTELRKEKYETWSRVMQQDQKLKDLGKALEEKKTSVGLSDFFKGMKILEASSTQESEYLPDPQNINENIRVGTGIWNIHIRAQCVKKEPPKDEPELWICPGKCDGCSHGKPHEYNEDCNNVCGPSRCIPVKKEQTAPQEPASVPKTDMEYLSARMMEIEQRQGRDRADLMVEIRDLIKSTGDLEIRLDNAESAIQKIQDAKKD